VHRALPATSFVGVGPADSVGGFSCGRPVVGAGNTRTRHRLHRGMSSSATATTSDRPGGLAAVGVSGRVASFAPGVSYDRAGGADLPGVISQIAYLPNNPILGRKGCYRQLSFEFNCSMADSARLDRSKTRSVRSIPRNFDKPAMSVQRVAITKT
jgi:hypothetical protein